MKFLAYIAPEQCKSEWKRIRIWYTVTILGEELGHIISSFSLRLLSPISLEYGDIRTTTKD